MAIVHLGFDMGIRNLAYCMITHTGSEFVVNAWNNVDLLEGGTSAQDAKRCSACSGLASYLEGTTKWCKACVTGVRRRKGVTARPTLVALPCGVGLKDLRALAVRDGLVGAKTVKKDVLLGLLSGRYCMPWKPAKATTVSLAIIRKAMDTWLTTVLPTFAKATLIRLENQPVMKGPTMKSVQIMLFTLLGHRLEAEHSWTGPIEFVHAGVKTRGLWAAAVDVSGASTSAVESAAYRDRKKTAEAEVVDILTKVGGGGGVATWLAFFNSRTKKSDLADAFLMAYRH